jgi:hypothetical protein
MKRYRLVYRGIRNAYYSFDTHTKRRESLSTGNADEAQRLVDTKNEAVHHAEMNLQIAQVYLQHSDPSLAARTWQHVMEKVVSLKTGSTRERWEHAVDDKAFDLIRDRKLLQTTSEHFLAVLNHGSVSTNVYLRRAHNFAIGMHWLPWPVLPKLQWPPVTYKAKRAITFAEHARIRRQRTPPSTTRAYAKSTPHPPPSIRSADEIPAAPATPGFSQISHQVVLPPHLLLARRAGDLEEQAAVEAVPTERVPGAAPDQRPDQMHR